MTCPTAILPPSSNGCWITHWKNSLTPRLTSGRTDSTPSKQQALKQAQNLDTLPEAPTHALRWQLPYPIHAGLPFIREDYFQLVDATGRALREDKGAISESLRALSPAGHPPDQWIEHPRFWPILWPLRGERRCYHCPCRKNRQTLVQRVAHSMNCYRQAG